MQGQNAKGYAGPILFLTISLGSRSFIDPVIFTLTRATHFQRLHYRVIVLDRLACFLETISETIGDYSEFPQKIHIVKGADTC